MARVHATAIVASGAEIADDAEIGPYCVIGPNVTIGAGCTLVAQVHIQGHTRLGPRCAVQPFASLGSPPQSVHYRGGPTELVIGADCQIRESVTMNIGTEGGGGITRVGEGGFFMANSHIGHDCVVGRGVTFANCATLGGHCVVGDHVFIGGMSAAHQFTRIGDHAMIAGMTGLRSDVIPFGLAIGDIGRLAGVNVVGLKRHKYSTESVRALRRAYRGLFLAAGSMKERLDAVEAELGAEPAVARVIAFVRAGSNRPLCRPEGRRED